MPSSGASGLNSKVTIQLHVGKKSRGRFAGKFGPCPRYGNGIVLHLNFLQTSQLAKSYQL